MFEKRRAGLSKRPPCSWMCCVVNGSVRIRYQNTLRGLEMNDEKMCERPFIWASVAGVASS
jgi:hypothetical protein